MNKINTNRGYIFKCTAEPGREEGKFSTLKRVKARIPEKPQAYIAKGEAI